MNSGDLKKVWEIKALKRKPRSEEAQKILERIAKQVQPIMRSHNWRVKLLSEFCPTNRSLLGVNVGSGINVKLRLRRANNDNDFLPYHEVLDTMLHELCHNAHGPHNSSFYKLWDELRKECEDLINKGISGSGEGFDLAGKRLGGNSHNRSLSSLRKAALTAAENRVRLGSIMPSGPKRIGGDSSIMSAFSPAQAAAMAAERRFQDNIWCASEFYDLTGEDEFVDNLPNSSDNNGCCSEISKTAFDERDKMVKSRKRSRESDNGGQESAFIDLDKDVSNSCLDEKHPIKNFENCGEASTSSSVSSHDTMLNNQCGTWQCTSCTLLNPPLAPICELCGTQKPKDENLKSVIWSCRFCTLENDVKMDKCGVCGSWRYSYGAPAATPAPYLGT
ncbi:hypothetical protein ACP275_08G174700 [Erythranthe tilingii]